ncbi:MAG: hypothetical protein JSS21_06390 [Proteobacteria bacterium]|nr:hypothetical protein [Pseudomonadota bacterium]
MQTKMLRFVPAIWFAALAACSQGSDFNALNNHISFDNDDVSISAAHQPDARINANGDLYIGDKALEVAPAQRDLLKTYYADAMKVRDDGIATGKLGAALGAHAIDSVVRNLAEGNPDKIDKEISPQADKVDQSAMKICEDVTRIKAAQDALADQLPVFKPYAQAISDKDDRDCRGRRHVTVRP